MTDNNMEPSYRGVSKSSLIQSLRDSEQFIRDVNLGEATRSVLDEFNVNAVIQALKETVNDAELAMAMRETEGLGMFARMSDMFNHWAAFDTNSKGREVHQQLSRWGAFTGFSTADYRQTDFEQDMFKITDYMRRLRNGVEGHTAALEALFEQWKTQYKGEDHIIEGLHRDLLKIQADTKSEWERNLFDLFESKSLRERYQALEIMRVLSDSDELLENVKHCGPFQQYGIVIENAPKNFEEMHKCLEPIGRTIQDALQPYYDLDEITMTAVGAITPDFKYNGFVVWGTKRAAQALANALPDWTVIDSEANVMKPDNGAQPSKPAP